MSQVPHQALDQRTLDESALIEEMEVTGKAFDTVQQQNGVVAIALHQFV